MNNFVTLKPVLQQVAEAKCQEQHYSYNIPGQITTIACGEFGNDCIGLQWPTLSRKCPVCYDRVGDGGVLGWAKCSKCNGSGRIPDVTLEKVVIILATDGVVSIQGLTDDGKTTIGFCAWLGYPRELPDTVFKGATPLEAACAALLAL